MHDNAEEANRAIVKAWERQQAEKEAFDCGSCNGTGDKDDGDPCTSCRGLGKCYL